METKITRKDENEATVEFSGLIWIERIKEDEFKKELAELIDKYAI